MINTQLNQSWETGLYFNPNPEKNLAVPDVGNTWLGPEI
jgi:hypothetical protein